MSKKQKNALSKTTVSIIDASVRNDAPVNSASIDAEKSIPQTPFDAIDFSKNPFYSFSFVNSRADNNRVRHATAVEYVDDTLVCVACKRLYTFTLRQLSEQLISLPAPKKIAPKIDVNKFVADMRDKHNPDYVRYTPIIMRSKFFADYLPLI